MIGLVILALIQSTAGKCSCDGVFRGQGSYSCEGFFDSGDVHWDTCGWNGVLFVRSLDVSPCSIDWSMILGQRGVSLELASDVCVMDLRCLCPFKSQIISCANSLESCPLKDSPPEPSFAESFTTQSFTSPTFATQVFTTEAQTVSSSASTLLALESQSSTRQASLTNLIEAQATTLASNTQASSFDIQATISFTPSTPQTTPTWTPFAGTERLKEPTKSMAEDSSLLTERITTTSKPLSNTLSTTNTHSSSTDIFVNATRSPWTHLIERITTSKPHVSSSKPRVSSSKPHVSSSTGLPTATQEIVLQRSGTSTLVPVTQPPLVKEEVEVRPIAGLGVGATLAIVFIVLLGFAMAFLIISIVMLMRFIRKQKLKLKPIRTRFFHLNWRIRQMEDRLHKKGGSKEVEDFEVPRQRSTNPSAPTGLLDDRRLISLDSPLPWALPTAPPAPAAVDSFEETSFSPIPTGRPGWDVWPPVANSTSGSAAGEHLVAEAEIHPDPASRAAPIGGHRPAGNQWDTWRRRAPETSDESSPTTISFETTIQTQATQKSSLDGSIVPGTGEPVILVALRQESGIDRLDETPPVALDGEFLSKKKLKFLSYKFADEDGGNAEAEVNRRWLRSHGPPPQQDSTAVENPRLFMRRD